MSLHWPLVSVGPRPFGLGPALGAHYPPQRTPTLLDRRQIFSRLCVKQINCHSADTFSRPRNRNLRIPRADLIWPNTGSTMCLRAAYKARPFGERSLCCIFSLTSASTEGAVAGAETGASWCF